VVPEAKRFRTLGIDPEFKVKFDQMFIGVVVTGDKTWAPSFSTFHSEFFKDVDNDIPKKNKEENVRNDVHISNDVHIDGNNQKGKTPKISTLHFKNRRKKSLKQIGWAVILSSQIEKLCNTTDNMS
ncbi:hypothetical protein J1N35_038247, partial [Gossypium stocksii]